MEDYRRTTLAFWCFFSLIFIYCPVYCFKNAPSREELLQIATLANRQYSLSCPSKKSLTKYDKDVTNRLLNYKDDTDVFLRRRSGELKPQQAPVNFRRDSFDVDWVYQYCPEVVDYFQSRVAYFTFSDAHNKDVVLTTEAAMASVCLLKIVDTTAKRINMTWVLLAGSQLGAYLHGGPIPWDDDVDIMIDHDKKEEFLQAMSHFQIGGKDFSAVQQFNAVKLWVDGDNTYPTTRHNWSWPFIDIFSMQRGRHTDAKTGEVLKEAIIEGKRRLGSKPNTTKHISLKHVMGKKSFPIDEFFPLEYHFFGGLVLPTPSHRTLTRHYSPEKCVIGQYNHRMELNTQFYNIFQELDCCLLSKYFPFTYRFTSDSDSSVQLDVVFVGTVPVHLSRRRILDNALLSEGFISITSMKSGAHSKRSAEERFAAYYDGVESLVGMANNHVLSYSARKTYINREKDFQYILPAAAFRTTFVRDHWQIPRNILDKYKTNTDYTMGQSFTNILPNLNVVEIHNPYFNKGVKISKTRSTYVKNGLSECSDTTITSLKVVELNAGRGGRWANFAVKITSNEELRDADVIILNEMDVGMARSGNVHTTRMLAYALHMNYAWGLEFVELSNGDREEQELTKGEENVFSLHGNAILSKCRLSNGFIVRDKLAAPLYSSNRTFDNANGFEKRLGGRMGLFATVTLPYGPNKLSMKKLLVGSVHKISDKHHGIIKAAASGHFGTILAGDQKGKICGELGMTRVDGGGQGLKPSWKASCTSFGWVDGDIMCASTNFMKIRENMILPCSKMNSTRVISDHAIYVAQLAVKSE